MTVAHDTLLVGQRFLKGLPQGYADIFDRMVIIYMQVPAGRNFQVKRAVTSNLLQHVLEKRNSGIEMRLTAAIQVKHYIDLGFQGIATDICTAI